MIFVKDSVITKVLIKKGNNGVDTVYVATQCPDVRVTKIIPVEIKNEIKAGHPIWKDVIGGITIATLFFVIGYFARDGPCRMIFKTLINREKASE